MKKPFYILIFFFFLLACDDSKVHKRATITKKGPIQPSRPYPRYQICSFNVQFLGSSRMRDNDSLADYVWDSGCDVVAVQELIAPPDLNQIPSSVYFGSKEPPKFPSGDPFNSNERTTAFFLSMHNVGYDQFWLSPEDTGRSEKNQSNGTNTEWHVLFFKSNQFKAAHDLPHGYLSEQVSNHAEYVRVPYAFALRDETNSLDFVLINVHLQPGGGTKDRSVRARELGAIRNWIEEQTQTNSERDYIILGDMNIENGAELLQLEEHIISPFRSLNIEAKWATNTNINGPKPYDHVMIHPLHTAEVQLLDNFNVLNLIEFMKPRWNRPAGYPGEPYNHNIFRSYFSDHHAVSFWIESSGQDDD